MQSHSSSSVHQHGGMARRSVQSLSAEGTRLAELSKRLAFIFSDSNVAHDAFTRALIDACGSDAVVDDDDADTAPHDGTAFVPLSTLLSYHRIGTLARDTATLALAARRCPSLVLSPDGTSVRRASAYLPRPDSYYDERTVYVEGLPVSSRVSVDSVTTLCTQFGAVTRVTIPHARGSSK